MKKNIELKNNPPLSEMSLFYARTDLISVRGVIVCHPDIARTADILGDRRMDKKDLAQFITDVDDSLRETEWYLITKNGTAHSLGDGSK